MPDPIVLYGATGYTGRLTARAIADRGVPLILAGRDAGKLHGLMTELGDAVEETRVADATDAAALRSAFEGAACVVSTAGPFLKVGRPVIEAAILAGAHYVDSTGEQAFAKWARDALDQPARDAGVTAVSMLAFEYALGDLAAELLLGDREAERLDVCYRIRHGVASAATKKSMLRVASRKGYQYRGGHLRLEPPAQVVRDFRFPDAERAAYTFAGGEALTVPEHANVSEVRTYMAAHPKTIQRVQRMTPLMRLGLRGPVLAIAERVVDARHEDPGDGAREETTFQVLLEARFSDEEVARCLVEGSDPYGLTAQALAEGAARLAAGEGRAAGVVAPATAFPAEAFLEAVRQAHGDLAWRALSTRR